MAARWFAGLLAAGLLAAGCTGDSGERDLPEGDKPVQPVGFTKGELWSSKQLGIVRDFAVELRGEAAVVFGYTGLDNRLAVVDAQTGASRWAKDTGGPLDGAARMYPGATAVGGAAADWSVLVPYRVGRDDTEKTGVAALSGKDGSVRWKRPLSGEDAEIGLLAADAGVALVRVAADTDAGIKTVALDVTSGRPLWERAGDWAYRLAGGVVLAAQEPDSGTESWVEGLDARSGRQLWTLQDRFGKSRLHSAAGGLAVVGVEDKESAQGTGPGPRALVLNAKTGRELHTLGTGSCETDGRLLIACSEADGKLTTIRAGKKQSKSKPFKTKDKALDGVERMSVDLVWRERIFVSANGASDSPSAVVDRAGNVLLDKLPGPAMAASEKYAVFAHGGKDIRGFGVHRAVQGSKPPAEPRDPSKTARGPLEFGKRELWTLSDEGLEDRFSSVKLDGELLLTVGSEESREWEYSVFDAASGKPRWRLAPDDSLGDGAKVGSSYGEHQLAGPAGDRLLLLEYEKPSGEEASPRSRSRTARCAGGSPSSGLGRLIPRCASKTPMTRVSS